MTDNLLHGPLEDRHRALGASFAGALGVTIGMVGLDPMTAEGRFTFGSLSLMGGIPYVAAMIGFFGVAEALYQLRHLDLAPVKQRVGSLLPDWRVVRKLLPLSMRTGAIGVIIGALPGTGGDIAALMAYDHAKRTVKHPTSPFGEGAYEGLVAPESANNAAVGGAYIPMLTLGIPGDAVTAVIIGALYIHGLKPGPLLMVETPHLFWFTVGSLTLANLCLLVFGLRYLFDRCDRCDVRLVDDGLDPGSLGLDIERGLDIAPRKMRRSDAARLNLQAFAARGQP